MNGGSLIIIVSLALMVPIVSFAYVGFRLKFRIDQLRNFFSLPEIRKAYLASKGQSIENRPEDELEKSFEALFKIQLSREYGFYRFLVGIFFGSSFAAMTVYVIAPELAEALVKGQESELLPIHFALLGAYVWTLWLLLGGMESLNLTPISFFWIPVRFIVALVVGSIAPLLFSNLALSAPFVLVATAIPYPEFLSFLRNRILGMSKRDSDDITIRNIQGMHPANIETLEPLGIRTTQELAYADPLMLLFRTNLTPKVLIDWIDQALLFNYVGGSINDLRIRGIRGAIEMYAIDEDKHLRHDIATILKISCDELDHFTNMLGYDHQVRLVMRIWDQFEVD